MSFHSFYKFNDLLFMQEYRKKKFFWEKRADCKIL